MADLSKVIITNSALEKSSFVQFIDKLCLPVLFMTVQLLHMGVFTFFSDVYLYKNYTGAEIWLLFISQKCPERL